MSRAPGSVRVPSVVAYGVLLALLIGLYRFTALGIDRTPAALPCATAACRGPAVAALHSTPRSPLHRWVAVRLSEQSLAFLLDTGSASSVLSRDMAERLGLLEKTRVVLGAVNDDYGLQRVMPVARLDVANRSFGDFEMSVIDMSGIIDGLGPEIAGVLGADVLGLQPFEIDFAKNALRLGGAQDDTAQRLGARAAQVPLQSLSGGWFVRARADEVEARFLIDTGSNVSQIGAALGREIGGVRVGQGTALDASGRTGDPVASVRLRALSLGGVGRRDFEVAVGDPAVIGLDFFSGLAFRLDPETKAFALWVSEAASPSRGGAPAGESEALRR